MAIPHIRFKKAAATVLLALLIFIHAEKAIHHHENSITKSQENGFSIASKTFVCSICDYVFAKDAGLPEQLVLDTPVHYFQESISPVFSFYFDSAAITIADRGPPAC